MNLLPIVNQSWIYIYISLSRMQMKESIWIMMCDPTQERIPSQKQLLNVWRRVSILHLSLQAFYHLVLWQGKGSLQTLNWVSHSIPLVTLFKHLPLTILFIVFHITIQYMVFAAGLFCYNCLIREVSVQKM